MDNFDCNDCRDELNLCKLCVKKARIKWLQAHSICTDKFKTDLLDVKGLKSENVILDTACVSTSLQAKKVLAESLNTNDICARTGVINSLCVNNLSVNNLTNCVKYRASVTLSAPTNYNLGNLIDWDIVIDDPNNNVATGPFKYTVPVSGYYSFDFHLNTTLISGATPLGGTPAGMMSLLVNGVTYVNDQVGYLAFSGFQASNMGGLILMNAGDIVEMKYEILALDATSGIISYVGTTVMQGNGALAGQSYFNIHFLSSLSCSSTVCPQCPMVSVSCPVDPCMTIGSGSVAHQRRSSPIRGSNMFDDCESCQ